MEEKLGRCIMGREIKWIGSDGGPHILIERRFLHIWKGESDEDFERARQYYEEAGLIEDYIGELNIGSGKCIIISDDVPVSTWLPDGSTGGVIVVANYINDDGIDYEILAEEINKIPDALYHDINLTCQVIDQELYLFPACDFGAGWMYEYMKVNLEPGYYIIKLAEEYIFRNSSFRLFKFSREKGIVLPA